MFCIFFVTHVLRSTEPSGCLWGVLYSNWTFTPRIFPISLEINKENDEIDKYFSLLLSTASNFPDFSDILMFYVSFLTQNVCCFPRQHFFHVVT